MGLTRPSRLKAAIYLPSQHGYDMYGSARQAALEMNPNADEARAAHYNSACCYAKLGEWEKACDS
eukprot:scaffold459671_cov20-Prasinocladus_malaysianus.AAC.1